MKIAAVCYLVIGALLATALAVATPSMSAVGWLWYTFTWPWQLLCAQIEQLSIAPVWMIPYLFSF